jgi:hypothetical protein
VVDPDRMMHTDGSTEKLNINRLCMHDMHGSASVQPAVNRVADRHALVYIEMGMLLIGL